MKNLFARIKHSVAADFHEVLDKKEQKNPIALLNQYLRECEQEVEKVRALVERQYRLNEEFTREYNHAHSMAEKRKHQADVALRAGEAELHDFQYEERAARLAESQQQAASQLGDLERRYEEMRHKLKDMHIKRMELMGRENVARAQHRISRVMDAGGNLNAPFARFEEMEHYLDRIERQVNLSYNHHTIDARIAQLEKLAKKDEVSPVS